ncbi:MAG: DUF1194 domain-containing protein [Paracoccaceae bacterium]
MRRVGTLTLAGAFAMLPGAAIACALELILAMDVSGSVDEREFLLQIGGLANAFETEALAKAVGSLEGGMIVTLTQWSGNSRQRQTTGWHRVSDAESLTAFADIARGSRRIWRNFSTAIGEALSHAEAVSATAPVACRRRVIDVSGDGVSNEGQPPRRVADRLAAKGYVVNGLAIQGADPDPVVHYEAEVIAGPGAFVEVAADFDDYPRAILRKLLREIDAPLMVSER